MKLRHCHDTLALNKEMLVLPEDTSLTQFTCVALPVPYVRSKSQKTKVFLKEHTQNATLELTSYHSRTIEKINYAIAKTLHETQKRAISGQPTPCVSQCEVLSRDVL